MSISELLKSIKGKVNGIKDNVLAAYDAIAVKGGEVPSEKTMKNLPYAIVSIRGTLEELTITENGTYTPQGGVDGFSKVTARVVPTKRVVIANMQVTNEMLIDGYWAGELADTRATTTFQNMFYYGSQIQSLDVSGWDTSNVTHMGGMFRGCSQLQSLDVSGWDTGKVTTMEGLFSGCSQLQSLDVSGWDTSNVTHMGSVFRSCSQLQSLDVSGWDTSKATSMGSLFSDCSQLQKIDLTRFDVSKSTYFDYFVYNCSSLTSLIGGRSIGDILSNNISCLNGISVSIPQNTFRDANNIDRASLRALINGLADMTGQPTKTLTLGYGGVLLAKLTDEDIAIATSKNWTIA